MNQTMALSHLLFNLIRGALRSGLQAAAIILLRPKRVQPGFVWLDYGDLEPGPASLLAALVTLTPGSTALEIDPQQRRIRLHLLDIEQAEATRAEIQREVIQPLQRLIGGAAP
ncbi:MAG: Na+/H+ antiporter subunit E [Gammaproteobacteria bacterium SHHR-1]|uniref:Na+/H+ antiporter subunit E n=1 Tax=Magnetovirga frankeli TaxID=947516 RepID=UPI001AF40B48|nr:Na+/H+ antiporter subunit E [gamma proteobacterium SS-5]